MPPLGGCARLDRAMGRGDVGWTKALMVARIATPGTQDDWVATAVQSTSRELELMVARCKKGDRPPRGDQTLNAPAWMNVSFRLETRHYEQVMRSFARIRRQNGGKDLDGGLLLAAMAERVLTGSAPGAVDAPNGARENYRMVVHQCPECRAAYQETAAGRAELTDAALEMVECDAERVQGDDKGSVKRGTLRRTNPPTVRRSVLGRDEHRCAVPGCRHDTWLDLHHIEAFAKGGAHVVDNLVTCCGTHHDLLHQGALRVARADDGTLLWAHKDGRAFGAGCGADGDGAGTTHVSSEPGEEHEDEVPLPSLDQRIFSVLHDRTLDAGEIAAELADVTEGEVQTVLFKAKLFKQVEGAGGGRYRLPPCTQEEHWMQHWAMPGPAPARKPRVTFAGAGRGRVWPASMQG